MRCLVFILVILLPVWLAQPLAAQSPETPCLECHGPEGLAKNPQAPILAGQREHYLKLQLQAFRNGNAAGRANFSARRHPVMAERAHNYTDEEIVQLARAFSRQVCRSAREFDPRIPRDVPRPQIAQTCFTCHGVDGRSRRSTMPNLAGQRPAYLARQLFAFRDAKPADKTAPIYRHHRMMSRKGNHLSPEQIKQLALYFGHKTCW